MSAEILVTKHIYAAAADMLKAHGEIEYNDSSGGLTAAQLGKAVRGKYALVCQLTDCIDEELMDSGCDLKVIANVAVGYDNIDIAAASERGIVVTNTPGVLTDTTADLAFSLMLCAGRRIAEADRFLRAGHWKQWQIDLMCGHDIHGHTLGIVGLGRIGLGMARRARGFGMRVIYSDVKRAPADEEAAAQIEYVDRDTLLHEADFVSIHVPLTSDTRHLIGTPEFGLMKPTAVLINTARGPVVDESALADALENGEIASAALDVFEAEPVVDPRLLALENVVLVPHIGSASIKTRTRMCTMAAQNALAVLRGERPPNPVNSEVLDAS